MCARAHASAYVRACAASALRVCTRESSSVRARMRSCVCACAHAGERPCARACASARVSARACARACACICVCARVCVCVSVCGRRGGPSRSWAPTPAPPTRGGTAGRRAPAAEHRTDARSHPSQSESDSDSGWRRLQASACGTVTRTREAVRVGRPAAGRVSDSDSGRRRRRASARARLSGVVPAVPLSLSHSIYLSLSLPRSAFRRRSGCCSNHAPIVSATTLFSPEVP